MNGPNTATNPDAPGGPDALEKKALHRLFLTLFLRGRTARGLKKDKAPTSMGRKLGLVLATYALVGLVAFAFMGQPILALSAYLHAMTFAFLGMFLASSAGEVLFNKEEADILLHRPIAPRDLLWAKVRVLLGASFWLAGAFNLAGCVVGFLASDGGFLFVLAHIFSVAVQAVFCASCVVMAFQLCLRWFGRERLDGLITTAQVFISVFAVLGGQLLPHFMFRMDDIDQFWTSAWWVALLPPVWFAGMDDAIAGTGAPTSWMLGALAVLATALVLWIAFSKLAGDYAAGLQHLNESVSPQKRKRSGRRWIDILVDTPPLRWWLRDPVTRASFVLTVAYLIRDRDVKLRVYPAMAPIMLLPVIMIVPNYGGEGGASGSFMFTMAFGYLGILPAMGLSLLQYSQQWQASDVFRAAPMAGPKLLCDGARKAVICLLTLPIMALFGLIVCLIQRDLAPLFLLLPGIIAMPVFALIPNLRGSGIPLSMPAEDAQGTGRGLLLFGVMMISLPLSMVAALCWSFGMFHWFLFVETIFSIAIYKWIQNALGTMRWPTLE